MRVACLVENTVGNELCQTEHGLSLYIESKEHVILADTGAGGLFIENAGKLGVDLTKVEIVFLSHGHYDHGGGIMEFQKINPRAKIVMQKKAFGDYWHKDALVEKYIGLNPEIKNLDNLFLLDGDVIWKKECLENEQAVAMDFRHLEAEVGKLPMEQELFKENKQKDALQIFTWNRNRKAELKCWPEGNLVLKEKIGNKYVQDYFEHEQYMILRENEKSVLISGCAHNGILNILEECVEKYGKYPDVVISGFHMRKKTGYTKTDLGLIRETAKVLKNTGILCYTGHCTGEEAYGIMKEIMGEQLQYLHCGDRIQIL